MSSYAPFPGLQQNGQVSPETGTVTLWGSFQINTAALPTAGTGYFGQNTYRGSWFSSVLYVAAGHYRVQVNYKVPNNIVPVNTNASSTLVAPSGTGNGQPNGLLAEAVTWYTQDQTAYTGIPSAFAAYNGWCTQYDTAPTTATGYPNTFDIFYSNGTSLANPGAGMTGVTLWRVFFELTWKSIAYTP